MRPMALLLLAALAAASSATGANSAPRYPWCSVDLRSGTYSCSFVTYSQCMEDARGKGYCTPNGNG